MNAQKPEVPAGWVVLREKSYRQAQERQRMAEVRAAEALRHNESTTRWAVRAFDEQRRLTERCTWLYGLAARLGASDDDLRGPVVDRPKASR